MRLKSVKIYGFKTFATKTEIELDGSLIAVVGPNGCGKSNIVDAILWGLGETSAKHLRAQTGKEVIFSGSANRKPLGFAEVTLLFDNEDGSLPIDTPEVSITRRLKRSGDTQYQINRRNCRLRDVADLLADSGLGRAGYAIVGQSEIDQALAASPLQRRAWIDEAAGVQRYRARRQESLRRLAAADAHLERVTDVLQELDRQRDPLKRQAEDAKRYKSVNSSLREMELGLLATDVAKAIQQLTELDERSRAQTSLAKLESERADDLEKEAEEASQKIAQLSQRIEVLREQRHSDQTALEQASSLKKIAEHKIDSLAEWESRMSEESDEATGRLELSEKDLEEALEAYEKESVALESLKANLASADDEAKGLAKELKQAEHQLREGRQRQDKRQRLEVEQTLRQDRLKEIAEETKGIVEALPDLQEAVAEAEKQFEELHGKLNEARADVTKAEEEMRELREASEHHAAKTRAAMAELAALDGRKRGILATLEAHEGLAHGAKAVLEAAEDGRLQDKYIPVGEAIDVDPDVSLAVETALGNSVHDLIVDDEQAAKAAIEFLKKDRAGRATFQPLTLMREQRQNDDLRAVLGKEGVVGLGSDLVECDKRHVPVIESLLGRIVVVETLDVGLKLAKTRGWKRLVSLDGEVIHGSGAVSGGRTKSHRHGMVQRRAELHEIEDEAINLQASLDKMNRIVTDKEEIQKELNARIDAGQPVIKARQIESDEAKAWLLSLQHEIQATEKSQERLERESKKLNAESSELIAAIDIPALEAVRDDLMKRLAGKSSDSDQAAERLNEAEARTREALARKQEAERRLSGIKDADSTRERRAENLEPDRAKYKAQIEESEKEIIKLRKVINEAAQELDLGVEAKKLLYADTMRLAEEAKKARKAALDCGQSANKAEVARARADSRRAASAERLLEEYGVSEEEAVKLEPSIELPDDAPRLVSQLRKDLKSMGEVNLGAIEAYDSLTERWDELSVQSEDIIAGAAEIQEGIKELDVLTKDRFVETFEKLQIAFKEMYQTIFSGGEGELQLTDSDNILDSGVEIEVTIPGKRRQRLALLSGGERALSALAFLFALLRIKPTPLVVLDEVDAPLDGRNVERYVNLLDSFTEEGSQFILVTHNPRTIQAADVWFGVTMQEPGVSTVVPFKAPREVAATIGEASSNGQTSLEPASAKA